MIVGDIVKVRILTTQNNQNGFNIFHAQVTGVVGAGSDLPTLATAVDAALAPLYKALMANDAIYRGVGVQKIWPLPETLERSTIASLGNGTAGTTSLPGNVAGLISLRTAFGGRPNRGRAFLPFPATADVTVTGGVAAGYVTRLNPVATFLLSTLAVGPLVSQDTYTWGIYHRKSHTITPINNTMESGSWWSQRRREFGRKPDLPPF